MAQIDGQMEMDLTTDELIRQYRTEDRLRSDYIQTYSGDLYREAVPEGAEVIVQERHYDRRGHHDGDVYYRTRLEYHTTVSGPTPRLVSDPDGDWPSVPPWQPDLHGAKWTHPCGASSCFYVRRTEK